MEGVRIGDDSGIALRDVGVSWMGRVVVFTGLVAVMRFFVIAGAMARAGEPCAFDIGVGLAWSLIDRFIHNVGRERGYSCACDFSKIRLQMWMKPLLKRAYQSNPDL